MHRVVEGRRADPGEDATERPLAWRADLPCPRVAAPAEDSQRLLRAAGGPVRDRGRRVMPRRGERAHGQREHEFQRVPAPQRRAGVRNPGQPPAQARAEGPVSGQDSGQVITGDVNQGR